MMFISPQRYTSSPVKPTNTEAGRRGTISLTWMAAAPSDHSWYTATWQVRDMRLPSQLHALSVQNFPVQMKTRTKKSVFCPPEDKTWTIVEHNNTELTNVRPQPGTDRHIVHFEYASEEEQLAAIIGQSEHCEQELTYHCRRSRILNSPGKTLKCSAGYGHAPLHHRWQTTKTFWIRCQFRV